MIKYVQGDLFQAPEGLLAHGCNCSGGFGSGVAAGMAHNHRKARDAYLEQHNTSGGWILGAVQFVRSGNKWIANCATQQGYLPRGICHANYDAIKLSMTLVKQFAQKNGLTIAIPKIGAGLAGGDWNIIEKILEEVFSDYDITIYYL